MTQKQFIKQLMSRGVSHSDANTMQFVPAKVYSYEETFQRMQEGRDIFC